MPQATAQMSTRQCRESESDELDSALVLLIWYHFHQHKSSCTLDQVQRGKPREYVEVISSGKPEFISKTLSSGPKWKWRIARSDIHIGRWRPFMGAVRSARCLFCKQLLPLSRKRAHTYLDLVDTGWRSKAGVIMSNWNPFYSICGVKNCVFCWYILHLTIIMICFYGFQRI